MKYLKLYEEYDEKLYHEFDIDINDLPWNKPIATWDKLFLPFTKYEKDKFNKLGIIHKYSDGVCKNITFNSHNNGKSDEVYKMGDEWFYVIIDRTWYKCDTMDGVIQLLKDRYNIQ